MSEYKDAKTGMTINVSGEKSPTPTTGVKVFLKGRPPIAKIVPSD